MGRPLRCWNRSSLTMRPPAPAADRPSVSPIAGVRRVPFLRLLVFAGGFASIGVELTASRLLAPYFGSSTFIWASLIGLTLTFLSLGYWLGGRIADRHPTPALLYALSVAAALVIAIIPIVARPLLSSSLDAFRTLDAGAFYGSLAGHTPSPGAHRSSSSDLFRRSPSVCSLPTSPPLVTPPVRSTPFPRLARLPAASSRSSSSSPFSALPPPSSPSA